MALKKGMESEMVLPSLAAQVGPPGTGGRGREVQEWAIGRGGPGFRHRWTAMG